MTYDLSPFLSFTFINTTLILPSNERHKNFTPHYFLCCALNHTVSIAFLVVSFVLFDSYLKCINLNLKIIFDFLFSSLFHNVNGTLDLMREKKAKFSTVPSSCCCISCEHPYKVFININKINKNIKQI